MSVTTKYTGNPIRRIKDPYDLHWSHSMKVKIGTWIFLGIVVIIIIIMCWQCRPKKYQNFEDEKEKDAT